MAERRFTSQFSYSFEKMPVRATLAATKTASGAFATITKGGVSGTAVIMGTEGNSITLAYTTGGTAGAEVVTVSGNAISVQIESGVSTITQVRTALNASVAAAALATFTGTSATTVAAAAATSFSSGADTTFTYVQGLGQGITLTQTGTGVFVATLPNKYNALLGATFTLGRASGAVDLTFQIASESVASAKTVTFRSLTGATPTNPAVSDVLYIAFDLRNN
jgi:hypothetical protein